MATRRQLDGALDGLGAAGRRLEGGLMRWWGWGEDAGAIDAARAARWRCCARSCGLDGTRERQRGWS